MGELSSALDALAADDIHSLFAPALIDRTEMLLAARNRLDAELARTVREAEVMAAAEHDGLKTMASWLRGHGRLSPAAATRVVRMGRALADLPAVAAGAADGVIPAEAVTVLAAVTTPEHVAAATAQGVDLAAIDTALAEVAATRPHDELRQVVAHYLGRLNPDGPEPDPTEGRRFAMFRHDDGRLSFSGEVDAVAGDKVAAALEAHAQADRPVGDTRTRSEQLADAFVQLVDNQLASGNLPFLRKVKPHVLAKVDLADLIDPAPGPAAAETGFKTLISAARARWLACDGTISRIIMGPDGRPLDFGRSQRLVPAGLRIALDVRDKGCVFAGCGAPTYWCDAHHLVHWTEGGETAEGNFGLLCERHHTKCHHGFRIERDSQGRWHTYRPDGTEILIPAPLLL
ncbi:MAG: DUF222 domain-containing protein [Blastococcus sp.]